MRRWAILITVAALATGLAACGGDDDDSNAGDASTTTVAGQLPDLGGKSVTVAVENLYPPFNYIDPDTDKGAGWDYDAWRAICEKLNCKADFKEASWDGMIQAVSDDQYDAAADGITITDDRAKVVDFSDGYTTVDQRLLVRLDEENIDSPEYVAQNEDVKIGTQTGTTNYEKGVALWGKDRVNGYDTFPFAVEALVKGDIDVVIIDETAGQGYLGANRDKLKLVGEPMKSDELGFIFPKGSDLVAQVNAALAALEADGTLNDLEEKYFSEDFLTKAAEIDATSD